MREPIPYIVSLTVLQALVCCLFAQHDILQSRQQAQTETSLQQAADMTIADYVRSEQAKTDEKTLNDLLYAMMMAGTLPDTTGDLGEDENAGDNRNANRRNQRDRRKRDDRRRRNNRNQRQRQDDNNRTRNRIRRTTQRRADDTMPSGAGI